MSTPLVSVLLPNLNYRDFLEERIDSIRRQTMTDWELVIVDNYSDDGAWEYFQEMAAQDDRLRISQAKREGMYANWNNCIRQARGKYVYVATSDDSMMPQTLEVMTEGLETHGDCDLCDSQLIVTDTQGHRSEDNGSTQRDVLGSLYHQPHIRRRPYDAVIYLSGIVMYKSITQLLIRRSLFDRADLFPTNFSYAGDYAWELRASLLGDTLFIPQALGTFHVHNEQGSHVNTVRDRYRMRLNIAQAQIDWLKENQPQSLKLIKNFDALWNWFDAGCLIDQLVAGESRSERLSALIRILARHPGIGAKCFRNEVNKRIHTDQPALAAQMALKHLGPYQDCIELLSTEST